MEELVLAHGGELEADVSRLPAQLVGDGLALRSGCASLGFSDHSPMPLSADPDGWSMKPEKVHAYRTEIKPMFPGFRPSSSVTASPWI